MDANWVSGCCSRNFRTVALCATRTILTAVMNMSSRVGLDRILICSVFTYCVLIKEKTASRSIWIMTDTTKAEDDERPLPANWILQHPKVSCWLYWECFAVQILYMNRAAYNHAYFTVSRNGEFGDWGGESGLRGILSLPWSSRRWVLTFFESYFWR